MCCRGVDKGGENGGRVSRGMTGHLAPEMASPEAGGGRNEMISSILNQMLNNKKWTISIFLRSTRKTALCRRRRN